MGAALELATALTDAYNICKEYGQGVTFNIREEGDVARDNYRSIVARPTATSLAVYCYPVLYSPTERDLVRAGLKEMMDVVIYAPTLAFANAKLSWGDLDPIRSTVVVDGQTLKVREKARISQFLNGWLYYTFGLRITG